MQKNKIMSFFSDLGRSLLLPIASLAACGIFLGITSALLKTQVQEAVPFLSQGIVYFIISSINKVANVVFTLLPVLFAISISFGLAKEEKEIAAFAGFVGYYVFLVASSCVINSGVMEFSDLRIASILGVETMDMGAVAGMITGIVTAFLHNKYHKVSFPVAIAFYGGKRFVALVVIVAMAAIGFISPFVWSPVSVFINSLGSLISAAGIFGTYIYGFLERLLIPTGLHHVLNGIFRTTSIGGSYQGVDGCLNIFLQFVDKVDIRELKPFTVFLGQGKMPVMMFGLPGAALAMYRTAPAEKKDKVKALVIAGVAASIVSGITEPMEFSFMFIAPPLFLFHALMGGLSFMLMDVLGVVIGNTGGGVIDYLIWGVFQPGSRWYWVLIVGPVFSVIYYFVFKTYFIKKNISIEVSDDDDDDESVAAGGGNAAMSEKARALAIRIIQGLGGLENIQVVNNCLTRLRVDVKDMSQVQEDALKKTGALGFAKPSANHIQVIYGPKVEKIAADVREVINSGDIPKIGNSVATADRNTVYSPLSGTVITLKEINDGVFSEGVLGNGCGIIPSSETVVAPFDGEITTVAETKHALGIASQDGMELLIHVGVDTVSMEGKGFQVFVKEGDKVKRGQKLLTFSKSAIKEAGFPDTTAVLVTNSDDYQTLNVVKTGDIKSSDKLITLE